MERGYFGAFSRLLDSGLTNMSTRNKLFVGLNFFLPFVCFCVI